MRRDATQRAVGAARFNRKFDFPNGKFFYLESYLSFDCLRNDVLDCCLAFMWSVANSR